MKEQVPLSESIIGQIHYMVLADKKEDQGIYRRVLVRIMGAKYKLVIERLFAGYVNANLDSYLAMLEEVNNSE